MEAVLTAWEETQVKRTERLLVAADSAIHNFESNTHGYDVWMVFRYFLLDLYSILDYTWFLLHCHFANGGELDRSKEANFFSIPYSPSGLKVEVGTPRKEKDCEKSNEKSKKKYKCKKVFGLWGADGKNKSDDVKLEFGEGSYFWELIGERIYNVQPKLEVKPGGKPIDPDGKPKILPGDQESFAMLHYYRNFSAHKDFVRFKPSKWLQRNQRTGTMRFVSERDDNPDCFYIELAIQTCEIDLPPAIQTYEIDLPPTLHSGGSRLLLDVMKQLEDFVRRMVDELLTFSLIKQSWYSIQRKVHRSATHQEIIADFKLSLKNLDDHNEREMDHNDHNEREMDHNGHNKRKLEVKYDYTNETEQNYKLKFSVTCETGMVFTVRSHPKHSKEDAAKEVVEELVRLGLLGYKPL